MQDKAITNTPCSSFPYFGTHLNISNITMPHKTPGAQNAVISMQDRVLDDLIVSRKMHKLNTT
jgi:hypothetical protein